MVNSLSSYGGGMNSYSGMNQTSFGGGQQSSNVPRAYLEKYGNGYEDFNSEPYVQPYPFAYTPCAPEPITERNAFLRFLKHCFFM